MEKPYVAKKYIFCICQLLMFTHLFGQVKQQVLPGIWHSANSWSPIGIPTSDDSVIVVSDIIIQESMTARAKHVTVTSTGMLTIENNIAMDSPAKLNVDNSPGAGISNQGIILNKGHIVIDGAAGKSIVNTGTSENVADAIVELKNQGDFGIWNLDSFMNYGNLKIQNSPTAAIKNSDYFINHGKLVVKNTQGFDNNGYFENTDSVIIRQSEFGLTNADTFFNLAAGVLLTEETEKTGFHNSLNSYCLNEGVIEIDSIVEYSFDGIGMLIKGFMLNKGQIAITRAYKGIEILNDTLHSSPTSILSISGGTRSMTVGNSNDEGYWRNDGFLSVYGSSSHAIQNSNVIENNGQIHTEGAGRIYNGGTFTNNGKIECLNGTSFDTFLNNGHFHNKDTLFIRHAEGWGFSNELTVLADSGSLIHIQSNLGSRAFSMDYSFAHFTNYGTLQIDSSAETGLDVNFDSYLENFGNIHIHQAIEGINIEDGGILLCRQGSISTVSNINIGVQLMYSGLLQLEGLMKISHSSDYGLKQGRDFESDPGNVIITTTGEMLITASSGSPAGIYIDAVFDCQGKFDAN